jgi:hypothetical protein
MVPPMMVPATAPGIPPLAPIPAPVIAPLTAPLVLPLTVKSILPSLIGLMLTAAYCLRKIWWINMLCPLDRGYEKGPERLAQGLMFGMNIVLICI